MPRTPPAASSSALFTLSGFAGLIYQSIWSHYLKLFLGHAAYAQTLVLAIFMGGMALGAWLVARFTHRIRSLLLGYAIAELGSGHARAPLPQGLHRGDRVGLRLGAACAVGRERDLFKWALASALILPASILLGTTFPLMSAGILRAYPDQGGRALSMLYFTNSFGAAVGVLASGLLAHRPLRPARDDPHRGLLNVLLALTVWVVVKRMERRPIRPMSYPTGTSSTTFSCVILVLAFLTGTASFIYEVTWIRMAHPRPGRLDARLRGDDRSLHPRDEPGARTGSAIASHI
jgi:hypothetical protein